MPETLDVHIIVDNYATHKHQRVKRWLAARPRFHVHFTPTYASWLNQVEIWFDRITQQAIRRETFRSVKDLVNSRSASPNSLPRNYLCALRRDLVEWEHQEWPRKTGKTVMSGRIVANSFRTDSVRVRRRSGAILSSGSFGGLPAAFILLIGRLLRRDRNGRERTRD